MTPAISSTTPAANVFWPLPISDHSNSVTAPTATDEPVHALSPAGLACGSKPSLATRLHTEWQKIWPRREKNSVDTWELKEVVSNIELSDKMRLRALKTLLESGEKDFSFLDFSGLDFTRLGMNIDFSGAHLVGANFQNCVFPPGANFANAVMFNCRFINAELTGANFDSINLFEGINLFQASNVKDIYNFSFDNLRFANPIFSNANLTDAHFIGANISGALFYSANLTRTDFTRAKVEVSVFNRDTIMSAETRQELISNGAYLNDV